MSESNQIDELQPASVRVMQPRSVFSIYGRSIIQDERLAPWTVLFFLRLRAMESATEIDDPVARAVHGTFLDVAVRQLEEHGYLRRNRRQIGRVTAKGWDWFLRDTPPRKGGSK